MEEGEEGRGRWGRRGDGEGEVEEEAERHIVTSSSQ